MSDRLESYKCPSCSAPLRYDPSGKLVCDSCSNEYDPEVIEMMDSYDRQEAEFDWGNYKESLTENGEKIGSVRILQDTKTMEVFANGGAYSFSFWL